MTHSEAAEHLRTGARLLLQCLPVAAALSTLGAALVTWSAMPIQWDMVGAKFLKLADLAGVGVA